MVLAFLLAFFLQGFQIKETWAGSFTKSNATRGEINGKSTVAGLCSLLLWPGIGQYMNDCETKKNITHAILGITGIFRLWSGWDALVQRRGGYWDGKL